MTDDDSASNLYEQLAKIADDLYGEGPEMPYDNGGTKDGWNLACRKIAEEIRSRDLSLGARNSLKPHWTNGFWGTELDGESCEVNLFIEKTLDMTDKFECSTGDLFNRLVARIEFDGDLEGLTLGELQRAIMGAKLPTKGTSPKEEKRDPSPYLKPVDIGFWGT